jgi:hypothetical protein
MTRPAAATVLGIAAVGLAAATVALHPRAAGPAVALCALLHVARYTRLAVVLLLVLMIATLAGVRVDAAPPAPPAVER